eukprot:TRINITY_DN39736_c0_g1_i2.p1 TRINITY_DN39736_c0_g1~~TRINITY_DN39736_c0_g1_i2.p1  ORF type:complete len:367 (+),score=119.80 TRINITY_DN39736_c0_g1_i2:83-1183(+)
MDGDHDASMVKEDATVAETPAEADAKEANVGEIVASTASAENEAPPISKAEARRQRKARLKVEKAAYNQSKAKEKKQRQRKRRQTARQDMLGAMTDEERNAFVEKEKTAKRAKLDEETEWAQRTFDSGKPKVVINCSFGDQMTKKEFVSVAKQAQLSYCHVRDLRSPVQLHLTSISEKNQTLPWFQAIGFQKWKVHVHESPVWEVFDAKQLVVMSPDAEEELDLVEEDKVYVVGGLVDRSVQKMQSRSQAEGYQAGRIVKLPLKRYGPPGLHPILNIDVVVRIIAERLKRPGPGEWEAILRECLPQRHQGGPTRRMRMKERKQRAEGQAEGQSDNDEDAGEESPDEEDSKEMSEEAEAGDDAGDEA